MQRFQGRIKKSLLNNTLAIDIDLILTLWTWVCINYSSRIFSNMEVGMWYHLVHYYVWTKSCSWWNQTLNMVKLNMVSLVFKLNVRLIWSMASIIHLMFLFIVSINGENAFIHLHLMPMFFGVIPSAIDVVKNVVKSIDVVEMFKKITSKGMCWGTTTKFI